MIYLIFSTFIFFFQIDSVRSAQFANQFIQFQLPAQWKCYLEGAEWLCQSKNEKKKREAIIILAAKLKGDQDSLDQYSDYLKQPKEYQSLHQKPVRSEHKYTKIVQLNQHAWVDSLHLESEIPGYYTRYLATVKKDIGVLVTYSVDQKKYQTYLSEFNHLINTLKVFRKTGGLNAATQEKNLFDSAQIPKHLTEPSVFPTSSLPSSSKKEIKEEDDTSLYLILLVAVGALGFILYRKKTRKPK